jgi:hypothetical protein
MIVRTLRGLAAAAAVVAISATASAQMDAPSRFGVSAGVGMPMGDFGDVAKMGFHVGGHWQTDLGDSGLKFRANLDYGRYGFSDDLAALAGDESWTMLGGVANIIYPVSSIYLIGGLGYYSLSSSASGSSSDSNLAYNIGAGMGKGKWFAEVRYLSIQADPSLTTIPIVVGLRF